MVTRRFKRQPRNLRRSSLVLKQNGDDYWNSLFRFIKMNKKALSNPHLLEAVCISLLDRLLRYKCSNFAIIRRIILVYYSYLSLRPLASAPKKEIKSLLLQLNLGKSMVSEETETLGGEIMALALDVGDLKYTTALVKYNMYKYVPLPDVCFCYYEAAMCSLRNFWLCVKKHLLNEEVDPAISGFSFFGFLIPLMHLDYSEMNKGKRILRRILIIYQLLKDFLGDTKTHQCQQVTDAQRSVISLFRTISVPSASTDESYRIIRRIILITRFLDVVLLKMQGGFSVDNVKCVRLFFRTTPEPLVSIDEVKELLYFLFKNTEVVNRLTEIYLDTFPESDVPYSPRSLKHLCRCAVRNTIETDGNFPNAVKTFKIPNTLVDFLIGAPE